MKSRLAASISSLAGGRSINICRTVPVQRTWETLKFRPWNQGIGSSNRSFISFVREDDSFAELGPAVDENDVSQLKLATEKHERFKWQNDSVRKRLSNNKTHPVKKCGSEKGSGLTHDESNQVMSQLLGSFSANRSIDAVKVDDIGSLGESVQPVEEHVDDAFSANNSTIRINGVDDQWQNDSVRKRLSNMTHPVNKCGSDKGSVLTRDESNQVTNQLPGSFSANRSIDAVKVNDIGSLGESGRPMEEHVDEAFSANSSTIRINGVNDRVSIHDILSLCGKVGNFEGLTWVGKESVDAFFKVGSESDSTGIVRKLNGYSIAGSHLAASILPSNSKASIPDNEIPESGLQFNTTLNELKKQLELKKLYYQDLELLHHGIMHIQCPPTISDD